MSKETRVPISGEFVAHSPDDWRKARERAAYDLHAELESEIREILRKVCLKHRRAARITIRICDSMLTHGDGHAPATNFCCASGSALVSSEPPIK